MKNPFSVGSLFVLLVTATITTAVGCRQEPGASAKEEVKLASVSVDELDSLVAAKQCVAVDANSVDTRRQMGVVPGALLLTDPQEFAVSELPSNRSQLMVFYCGGEMCKASHQAAKKALAAGYSNVKVMSAGIAGWTTAGKKVALIK